MLNTFNIKDYPEYIRAKKPQNIHKKPLNLPIPIKYLEKVSSNIYRLISPITWNKKRYFITFLDKKTRYLKVKLLSIKDQVIQAFREYKAKAKNNTIKRRIIHLYTDNSTEYTSIEF